MRTRLILIIFVALPGITAAQKQSVKQHVVASGGAVVKGGTYTGSAVVGQAIAAPLKGGIYTTKLGLYGAPSTSSFEVFAIPGTVVLEAPVGSTKTTSLRIQNNSKSEGTISVQLSAPASSAFTISKTSVALKRGEVSDVTVTFTAVGSDSVLDSVVLHGLRPVDRGVVYLHGKGVSGVRVADADPVLTFPDPASARIRITLPSEEAIQSIEAIDATGRTTNLSFERDQQSLLVNTQLLPNGAYTLLVQTIRATYTSRVLIQH